MATTPLELSWPSELGRFQLSAAQHAGLGGTQTPGRSCLMKCNSYGNKGLHAGGAWGLINPGQSVAAHHL